MKTVVLLGTILSRSAPRTCVVLAPLTIVIALVGGLVGCSQENDPNGPAWTRLGCDVNMGSGTLPMLISYRQSPARIKWNEKLISNDDLLSTTVVSSDSMVTARIQDTVINVDRVPKKVEILMDQDR